MEANGGKRIGHIHGSGGRMGSYFYIMFHAICMEFVLKQLVAHPGINKLKHKKKIVLAVRDIKDGAFWKSTHIICGVSYPSACFIYLCDKSDSIIGELGYSKRRTTEVLESSEELLLNMALFQGNSENDGELAFKEEQIFGENNEVEKEEDAVDLSMDGPAHQGPDHVKVGT